jgi:hypothetical protein
MSRKRRKNPKLPAFGSSRRAWRIIDAEQALLENFASQVPRRTRLKVACAPLPVRSCTYLLAHEQKLKEEARAQKGETKLKGGHPKAI